MVWYEFTTDRTGAHPQRQLASFTGYLQADGYVGYDKLYDTRIFDIRATRPTPLTTDLLKRIGQLYDIEAEVQRALLAPARSRIERAAVPRIADEYIDHPLETSAVFTPL